MEIPEKIWDFHGISQHCMALLGERDETIPSEMVFLELISPSGHLPSMVV